MRESHLQFQFTTMISGASSGDPNGQYVPSNEGQYTHVEGQNGPGSSPYEHANGPQGGNGGVGGSGGGGGSGNSGPNAPNGPQTPGGNGGHSSSFTHSSSHGSSTHTHSHEGKRNRRFFLYFFVYRISTIHTRMELE